MVAAYYCFRQADTGEISDFPRYGNLDTHTAPPPPRSLVASRMGWASGLQERVWTEELSDAVGTKTR